MNTFLKMMALGAVVLCLLATNARAENPLRLQDAINATLKNNPQLAGHEFRVKALQGEQQTAELKPQVRLSTHIENVAGSGEFKGADASELTLSLSSILELGDQRDARIGLVTARQQQLESSQRVLTLDVLTQVTQQFIALAAVQEQLNFLQQTHQLAQENVNSVSKNVQAGRTPEAELLRAKASAARVHIDVQKTRQQIHSERIKLSAFWAETEATFSQVYADLFTFSRLTPLPVLISNLEKNPDLMMLGDEINFRAAELRHAQAERKTNLEWSAGVRRLQVSDDSAFVLGLSMPLGSANRAAGAVATASAIQAGAEQARDATRLKLRAQLVGLHGAYEQALAEVNSLRNDVLPPLQQAMRSTANAFNQGRYSYLELNLAQRELLETQLAIIDAAARAHILNTEIERLTGAALPNNSDAATQP